MTVNSQFQMDKERNRVEKLIVLQPHYYRKLLERFSPPPLLLSVEKRFIDILKDRKLNSEQKLAMYQDILSVKGIRTIKRSTSISEIGKTAAATAAKKRSVSFNLDDTGTSPSTSKTDKSPSTSKTDTAKSPDQDESIWEDDRYKTAISPPSFLAPSGAMTSTPMRQSTSLDEPMEQETTASASSTPTLTFEKTLAPGSPGKLGKTKKGRSGKRGKTSEPYEVDSLRQLSKTMTAQMRGDSSDESQISTGKNLSRGCNWISYEEGCGSRRRK